MKVSYATKIWVSLAILSIGTAVCSVSYLYLRSRDLVLNQMGGRLADVGRTAVKYFEAEDVASIERLISQANDEAAPLELITQGMQPGEYRESVKTEAAQRVMAGADFQRLINVLRTIKSNTRLVNEGIGDKDGRQAIRFATPLARVPEHNEPRVMRFIADADYDDSNLPNPFGTLFFSNSDALLWALSGQVSTDLDFRYEDGQYLLSAGIPILNRDNKVVAILALDYDAESEANSVHRLLYWSWAIVITSFVLSILFAVLISRMLNRPIEVLRINAEKVRNKDFSARVSLDSNDELGLLGSAFNAMVEEIQNYSRHLETVNSAFARFVPRQFLEQLGETNIIDVKLGDHVQKQMTVLFTDIRSFSTITEYMSPRDSFEFINEYLRAVSPVIRRHGGFIDKFIGDAIMALFPSGPDAAVKAAIDMQKALEVVNREGAEVGRPAIQIGIGIHHGNLMLGTVGESERMDGTVISDAVNLASRLESLTKEYHSSILVSERVVRAISGTDEIFSRYLGTVKVKGKQTAVEIFEVFANQNNNITRIKIVSREDFEKAVRALECRKVGEALAILEEIVNRNPDDQTAAAMLERCRGSEGSAARSKKVVREKSDAAKI